MIKLKDILKQIVESKQVGNLYHFTYFNNISRIFEKGLHFAPDNTELSKYKNKFYIAATRDHTGYKFIKDMELTVRITLDGNKISEHYLIKPINVENIWKLNLEQSVKDAFYEERIWSSNEEYLDPKYMIKMDTIISEDEIKRQIKRGKEDNKIRVFFDDSIFKYINSGKLNFVKNFNNK